MDMQRVAIQGERGSNSHLAARNMLGPRTEIVPCRLSAEVLAAVVSGRADAAVLPIENSLHGAVAEHYDLLLDAPLRIEAEGLLRIEHHVIGARGTRMEALRTLLSHPVALSQCRRFLAGLAGVAALPFYDTAGSVRHVLEEGLTDTAGIAPRLAVEVYGGEVIVANVEDHPENFTRFHLLRRADAPSVSPREGDAEPNKMSVAFSLEHRPGTLVRALAALAEDGADLTKIESRPVPGQPWEYVFFVDLRFRGAPMADRLRASLGRHCHAVRELGCYVAAG